MIIPTRYDFIKQLLEDLGPPAEIEKKSREFIEFIEKIRDNFVYIRQGITNTFKVKLCIYLFSLRIFLIQT